MKATLNVKIQGVRGAGDTYQEKGRVVLFPNPYNYPTGANICVDAFKGRGETYERREECLITIEDGRGRQWEGTFAEFLTLIPMK